MEEKITNLLRHNLTFKIFQLVVLIGIVLTFMMNAFPEETIIEGSISKPLKEIGVKPPTDKLIFILIDGFSFRFTNSTEQPEPESIFGRFRFFQETIEKEPENTIFRPTLVEGPTFTTNGVMTVNTGSLPGQGMSTLLVQKTVRETLF